MNVRPAAVVAGWAAANVALFLLLIGLGESAFAIVLYGVAAVPMFVFAALVWVSTKRHGDTPARYRLTDRVGVDVLAGLGVAVIGVGLVYGNWVIIIGAAFLVGAAILAFRPRQVNPISPGKPQAYPPVVDPVVRSIPELPGRLPSTFPRPSGSAELGQAHVGDSRVSSAAGSAVAVLLTVTRLLQRKGGPRDPS